MTTHAFLDRAQRAYGASAVLYMAAAARVVVTSRRRFVVHVGDRRFTGDAISIEWTTDVETEFANDVSRVFGGDVTRLPAREVLTASNAGVVFDPDVLLAWLLIEGVGSLQ